MNVPRKLFALHSLDLWIYCREEGLSENMGTRQRKSKLPSSTWHTKATQIRHLRNFYRANNSMLLSGNPGSWWKRWRWRRERVVPTMEFFLSFSVLSRGSFFNCLLSLRVRFLLSGKTTPHAIHCSLPSYANVASDGGREGVFQGNSAYWRKKDSYSSTYCLFSVTSEGPTYRGYTVRETRKRKGKRGNHDQRGLKSHRSNWGQGKGCLVTRAKLTRSTWL